MKISSPNAAILSEADKCVMCGLCLPQCPTYQLSLDENESPRGRIALARALLSGALPGSAATQRHLDHCLVCRRCERVCPSGVRYGRIIDAVRREHPLPPDDTFDPGSAQQLRRLNRLAWGFQHSGLRWLFNHLGAPVSKRLRRLLKLLPDVELQQDWQAQYPADPARGRVQLFTGCVTNSLAQPSLRAAVRVLNACGYTVDVPATQACCGALALHAGDAEGAARLAQQNIAAFDPALPILGIASGCTATLAEYEDASGFRAQVQDICAFLARQALPALQARPQHIAVHTPCTQRNVLREEQAVFDLLDQLPGAEISPLPEVASCCGAAGRYLLDFPEQADAIRQPTVEAILALQADVLVTTNLGCAMHLQAGLREAGSRIEVRHPVDLIAAQLE